MDKYQVTTDSTQHGLITPHGRGVPHKLPTIPGEDSITTIFLNLAILLYPTGRAFRVNFNSTFYNLHQALNTSFLRVLEAAEETIDSTFPDNDGFEVRDAELWEFRLGLITNPTLTIQERRQAIARKLAYPRNIRPRQNPLFIESQLQLAGFNVFVHENRFFENGEYVYKNPNEIAELSLDNVQHGEPSQHGEGFQHGSVGFDVIANLAVPVETYSVGEGNLYATFFIGGEVLGETAEIDATRLVEFKDLVLKLKPAHTVAFTFINFV